MDQRVAKSFKNLSLNELYIKTLNAFLTFTYHEASIVELPQTKNVQRNYPSPFQNRLRSK